MDKKYVVDLSQQMRPEEEVNFPFSIDLKDATESMPELEHDADAVSYTHLDVYKRQALFLLWIL